MPTVSQDPVVPDANAVTEVTLRQYRGESDIAAMFAIQAGCRERDPDWDSDNL